MISKPSIINFQSGKVKRQPGIGHLFGTEELQKELLRKSIHMTIAVVPALAQLVGVTFTLALLAAGTLFYTYSEFLRAQGTEIAFIGKMTAIAARGRDQGKFVLGPITLGLGAMIALMLYPNPAAAVAIYALAFGDGLSSLAGKLFGTLEIPFTGGKTLEGSATCLLAVFLSTLVVTGLPRESLLLAVVAASVELLPSKDVDNLILPMVVGALAVILFL
jgi:phytol kinase